MKVNPPLIEYRKIGLLSTCIGNERIRVDTEGKLYHARNHHECTPGEFWSDEWKLVGELDNATLATLVKDIKESGVLSLPPATTDEVTEGGKREELFLMIDEVEQCYVVQNCDQPVLKTVIELLWGAEENLVQSRNNNKPYC